VTQPETRYAQSGDVNIAFQVVGEGPLDPSYAAFLRRLASFSRLILFDKRGTGMSDRVPESELPTLEQRMDDVRVVMDAVGSEEAALLGLSEGGPHVPSLRCDVPGADEGFDHAGLVRAANVGRG